MPRFRVVVPFEPIVCESLEIRSLTQIPDYELAGGIQLHADADGYVAELLVDAQRPELAKAAGISTIECFLAVLAAWNYAFQVRMGGVRSELIEESDSVSKDPGSDAITAAGTVFLEGHAEAVLQKGSLDRENDFFRRYDDLPEYVRSCLELNYLLVLSTRPPNRWLLAAIGLEALTVGATGAQATINRTLKARARKQLKAGLRDLVTSVGLDHLNKRIEDRIVSTTTAPLADHIHAYLSGLSIADMAIDDVGRWWRTRGKIAHGSSVEIDQGDLTHLIEVFQKALRRASGAET